MNSMAMILVANAAILASMAGPNLPDDFNENNSGTVPTITFSQSSSGVVTTTGKTKEKWLVSESWCPSCPAAKARFRAAGGDESHVITIAEAKRNHGMSVSSVPYEFTSDAVITYKQPPEYRSTVSMSWHLDGDRNPTKATILRHLRRGGPHQGKHWQKWHLESWKTQQLYALHDDDHNGKVPTFSESSTEAIVNGEPCLESIAVALSSHLTGEQTPQAVSGLFDITIDTPDSARVWIADLLSKQSVEFPAAGVSASWGGERTISITPGALTVEPGVIVSVKKFGVSVTTTLKGATFAPDLSWVKMELVNAPDLTVRFK